MTRIRIVGSERRATVLVLLALAAPTLGVAGPAIDVTAPPPQADTSLVRLSYSRALRSLLATGTWDRTPKGFRIITLSLLADGCAAEARRKPALIAAARACIERCLAVAQQTRPRLPRPETDDGLWLTHQALMFGAADAVGSCPDASRHLAVVEALARRSLGDPSRHVASYVATTSRWPADQTATLASLARYDRAHGTHLHEEPTRAWRAFVLGRALDKQLGLPWSEVTGTVPTAREPRGCALSWQTRYLHEFDDALAQSWWLSYRQHFLVERGGLKGFREWAPGRSRRADVDSGPIIEGVGAAATGLGIAAARAMGDEAVAEALERTAVTAEALMAGVPEARGLLPDAVRYLGAQLRP